MNHIAIRDNEGNYKVLFGRWVGTVKTEAEVARLVKEDRDRMADRDPLRT